MGYSIRPPLSYTPPTPRRVFLGDAQSSRRKRNLTHQVGPRVAPRVRPREHPRGLISLLFSPSRTPHETSHEGVHGRAHEWMAGVHLSCFHLFCSLTNLRGGGGLGVHKLWPCKSLPCTCFGLDVELMWTRYGPKIPVWHRNGVWASGCDEEKISEESALSLNEGKAFSE